MKHKIVGKVADLKLNNEGNFADVIVKRINENDSPLVMGQFILLTTKDDSKVYVGKVESEIPYVDAGLNYRGALIDSINTDVEIDALYKEANGLFLSYKLRMLGICYDNDKDVKYYSNIRTFPAQTSLFVAVPTKDFMNQLLLSAVSQGDNDTKDVIFEIGKLQYGTDAAYTKDYAIGSDNEVKVQFNATNLLRKRTAIFGKSGYGKSNTVKTVIGMMSVNHPNCGQLILDTNGEYALDNDQNEGLMDIFHEAGMKGKCVLYTNREVSKKHIEKFGDHSIKPLKFDVFDQIKPAFEIVVANLEGQKEPLYLNPWSSAMDGVDEEGKLFTENQSNPGLVWGIWYAALIRAGIYPANKKHTKTSLRLSQEYIKFLSNSAKDVAQGKSASEDADLMVNANELTKAVCEAYGFVQSGKYVETNDIEEMAKYAEWYVEFSMNPGSSMKGYSEIMEYPRRFYALKSFNYSAEDVKNNGIKTMSLGESVFRDLKENKIVILDLASVSMKISKSLATHILSHLLNSASKMFGDYKTRDLFKNFDVLVYIEEAQNYLKPEELKGGGSIYERVAKEGRKFHLGLVYVTQQPSAIDMSITSQTENIIAMHMSNSRDCNILHEIKDKFDHMTCKFLKDEAQKGLAYLFAEPHQPFVLPCQIHRFDKSLILKGKKK
jgi:hypothetical protein